VPVHEWKEPEVSRWVRVSTVLAAGAFVVGFRAHTTTDNGDSAAAAATMNAARASVLESAPSTPGVRVALADVAGLPALQGEPASVIAAREKKIADAKKAAERRKAHAARVKKARHQRFLRHKKAEAKRKQAAKKKRATPKKTYVAPKATTPTVVATPVPTPVYKAPTYTPPANTKPGYVGKDFDSKG